VRLNEEEYCEDIWFKLLCFYHAKTELYDRSLTDLRAKYDPTSAFVEGENRRWSNSHAISCYRFITKIATDLRIRPEIIKSNRFGNKCKLSAQGWIDTYNYLLENGEMDFMKDIIDNKKESVINMENRDLCKEITGCQPIENNIVYVKANSVSSSISVTHEDQEKMLKQIIRDIDIIVPDKVVEVTFGDNKKKNGMSKR